MKTFIIAEAGVNHNGSLDLALQLVEAAAIAGADAIKFQTFKADNVVKPGVDKAEYQKTYTGPGDQLEMIRALELSASDHHSLAKRCTELNIEFMSTPFDAWATELLLNLGMKRIKIASGELTNRPFLEYLAGFGLPMILSTGMATLNEVNAAIEWISSARIKAGREPVNASNFTVLHCTSNYPAREEDVNLAAIATLRQATRLPIGYSDHTLGIEISLAAVAMGATVIEKHFTLNKSLSGPDHQASLDPDELKAMIKGVRKIEHAWGDGVKAPRDSEIPVRNLVRRSAFAARELQSHTELTLDDIQFLRPGTGIGPEYSAALERKVLRRSVPEGQMLSWDDFE